MSSRALSFGAVADDYDRYRPGYPDSIVDVAVAHADGAVSTAIEVGAGTGKATVVFAARGIAVTAVEPDPAMGAVLARQTAGLPVQIVASSFEALDAEAFEPFDLLFAAAAFHWTDPATRWQRAAALVRTGGVVALFGAERDLADEALAQRVAALADEVMEGDDAPGGGDAWTGWTLHDAQIAGLRGRPDFTDVVETVIPRRVAQSADDFVAHLSTVSAYRILEAGQRAALLARIRAALPDEVDVTQDLIVHLARRA